MGNRITIKVDDAEISVNKRNQHRQISSSLLVGIILLPYVFSWFTLHKGYSTTARVLSLIYMTLALIISGPLLILTIPLSLLGIICAMISNN